MSKDLVVVEWLDAITYTRKDKELFENSRIKDLLEVVKTYGILFREDEHGIIILHEDAGDKIDCTIIPKKWIVSITSIKRNKKKTK